MTGVPETKFRAAAWIQNLTMAAGLLLAANVSSAEAPVCNAHQPMGAPWQLSYESPDIRVYQRRAARDAAPEVAAKVHWNSKPYRLYNKVWHYEHFTDFVPNLKRSDVLERRRHRVWVYQQLDFPAPVRTRHYVLESSDERSEPALSHYRIEWKLSRRFALPAAVQAIRPAAFSGCWDIRSAPRGGLEAIYQLKLDPGGLLPHWLAERGIRRYLIDLMTALRKELTLSPDPE